MGTRIGLRNWVYSEKGGIANVPKLIGSIFSDDFHRSSLGSNWTNIHTDSIVSLDGTKLSVAGSFNFNYDGDYIYTPIYTALENFTMTLRIQVKNTVANTCFGISMGMRSQGEVNKFYNFFNHGLNTILNASRGILSFKNSLTYSQIALDTVASTFAVNDILEYTYTRNKNVFTTTVSNLTTSNTRSFSYTYDVSQLTTVIPNTSFPCIWFEGAPIDLLYFDYTSNEYTYKNGLYIGDSIGVGYRADFTNRCATQIWNGDYSKFSVNAGAGDTTHDVINRINELKSFKAKYAIINLGVNDKNNGVTSTIFGNNLTTIHDALKSVNTKPIFVNLVPQLAPVSDFNTVIQNVAFTNNCKYIDIYTLLKGAGTSLNAIYDSGDHIHPNIAGHLVMANKIKLDAPEIL